MERPTDKRVIEVADALYADPTLKTSQIYTIFGEKFRVSNRRIDALVAKAKEYNVYRLNKAEEKKDDILVHNEIEVAKEAIISRERAMEILRDLAEGTPQEILVGRDANGEGIYKTVPVMPNDRIRALSQLAAMEAWNAPVETKSMVTVDTSQLSEDAKKELLPVARKVNK